MSYNSTTGLISANGPISVTDIKKALGVTGSSSLMQVFTMALDENKLNENSKYIPVPFPSFVEISEEDRKSVNYGHSYEIPHSLMDSAEVVRDGSFFPYTPPSMTRNAPLRMGDFRGYSRHYQNWFTLYPQEMSVMQGTTMRFSFGNWEELFELGSLRWANRIRNTGLEFGFLCSRNPYTEPQSSVYWLQLTDVDTIGGIDDWLESADGFRLFTDEIPVGTWYMVPCFINLINNDLTMGSFTQLRGFDGAYNVYLFPYVTQLKVVVTPYQSVDPPSQTLEGITVYVSSMGWRLIDPSRRLYEVLHLALGFANSGKEDRNIGYTLTFGGFSDSGNVVVPGGSEMIRNVVDNGSEMLILDNGENTKINVTCWDIDDPTAQMTVQLDMQNNYIPFR